MRTTSIWISMGLIATAASAACGESDEGGSGGASGPGGSGEVGSSGGGTSGGQPGSGDGGGSVAPSDPQFRPPTLLKKGDVTLRGITTDGMVIYSYGENGALEAISVEGGEPIPIDTEFTTVAVSGGVVGYWKNTQLNLWTKRFGKKENVSQNSPGGAVVITPTFERVPLFAGSSDGTRVAFASDPEGLPSRANVIVTSTDAPSLTPASGILVNLSAVSQSIFRGNCNATWRFVGNRFFAAHCDTAQPLSGTSADSGKVWTVSEAGVLARLDAASGPGAYKTGSLAFDGDGARVFLFDVTGNAVVLAVSTPGAPQVLGPATDGFVSSDGAAAIHLSTAGLRRSLVGGATTTTLVPGSANLRVVARAGGLGRLAVATSAPLGVPGDPDRRSDVALVDTSTENQAPAPIVSDPSAVAIGFTGDDARFVYIGEADRTNTGTLRSRLVSGGGDVAIATGVKRANVAPKGNRVVSFVAPEGASQSTFYTLQVHKADGSAQTQQIGRGIPTTQVRFSNEKVVFARFLPASEAGLYVLP